MSATHLNLSVPTCFALLDDATSVAANSMLFTDLQHILVCDQHSDWHAFLKQAQAILWQAEQPYYAVALFSYESGVRAQMLSARVTETDGQAELPSRILFFAQRTCMSTQQVAEWLDAQIAAELASHQTPAPAGIAGLRASVDEAAFHQAIERIRTYIAAGDTYQVNFTYRLSFDVHGSPLALYRRLRQRQPVPFGALICLPDGESILSFSPELFVQHTQGKLFARPMKGTAAASGDEVTDQQRAAALAQDPKNRAENLMIVDLLRNDLGRIALPGSVRVPALFEVERFSSVLQMTSRIEAQLAPHHNLADVIDALFPCGSITGAPKRRTMEIIQELESTPRGIYTGAIGWLCAPPAGQDAQEVGDFCLSVPIRTLHLPAPVQGRRTGRMGVGAGIVYDSDASAEYAECQLKASFLTGLLPEFELFETMRATQQGCLRQAQHLQRLSESAAYFGVPLDHAALHRDLAHHCEQLQPDTAYRLRLTLKPDGCWLIQSAVLSSALEDVKVMLSTQACRTDPLLLRHKTSDRQQYDEGWRLAERHGCFDMLFFNAQGHLTEGGRSNVFLRQGTHWKTPRLEDGVLPGIMRAEWLCALRANPQYQVSECSLSVDELSSADEIVVCNSLRGVMKAKII